jgi:hypothetical protein
MRPVIIYKVNAGSDTFLGIPLTSQKKRKGNWYVKFNFKGRRETAILVQARTLSLNRLGKKMGELSSGDYARICEGLSKLYGLK